METSEVFKISVDFAFCYYKVRLAVWFKSSNWFIYVEIIELQGLKSTFISNVEFNKIKATAICFAWLLIVASVQYW